MNRMTNISSRVENKTEHELCSSRIYSYCNESYTYSTCDFEGYTRYYFDNVLIKTNIGNYMILLSKDLDSKSFIATYNCLYNNDFLKIFKEDIDCVINQK